MANSDFSAPPENTRPKQIRVTITDLETGEEDVVEVGDDYLLICAGSCYLHHVQAYKNGTHVLTIKGRK